MLVFNRDQNLTNEPQIYTIEMYKLSIDQSLDKKLNQSYQKDMTY